MIVALFVLAAVELLLVGFAFHAVRQHNAFVAFTIDALSALAKSAPELRADDDA